MSLENFDNSIPTIAPNIPEGPFSIFSGVERKLPNFPEVSVKLGPETAVELIESAPNARVVAGYSNKKPEVWKGKKEIAFASETSVGKILAHMHLSEDHLAQDAFSINDRGGIVDLVVCDGATNVEKRGGTPLGVMSGFVSRATAIELAKRGVDYNSITQFARDLGGLLQDRGIDPELNETTLQAMRIVKQPDGTYSINAYLSGAKKDLGYLTIVTREGTVKSILKPNEGSRFPTNTDLGIVSYTAQRGDRIIVATDAYKRSHGGKNTQFSGDVEKSRENIDRVSYERHDDATLVVIDLD